MEFLFVGILLGLGAAMPIGPVNLEIARRNIRFGFSYGMVTGLGACNADLVYLVLLSLGSLSLLQYPEILRGVNIGGSIILAWFGIKAFLSNTTHVPDHDKKPSLIRYSLEGFIITLINPFTILFWLSVSSQVTTLSTKHHAILFTGVGVMIGTVGWIFIFNCLLHFSRKYLNAQAIKILNYIGGVILMGFAVSGLLRALT